MELDELFQESLRDAPDPADDVDRPGRLARAAAYALGAAGASLSVQVAELRVPFGASDDEAGRAEAMQFTEGEGPCLEAIAKGSAVDADTDQLSRRWPRLAARWLGETRYRSAFSEPVSFDGVIGALNVYLTSPDGRGAVEPGTGAAVAALVSNRLRTDVYGGGDTASAQRRTSVWVLIGIERARSGLHDNNAVLRRLRDVALARNVTLDELAEHVVGGTVPWEVLDG